LSLSRVRELRNKRRMAAQLAVHLELEDEQAFTHCIMTDISDGGAKLLFLSDIQIPDTFMLHLGGADQARWRCEIVWRGAREAGVRFVGSPVLVAAG
jgi:PilZ domain